MRNRIIAILEAHLSATDKWGGTKLASWRYGDSVVVDGIEDAADEIMKLVGGGKMTEPKSIETTEPITLHGYNYPPISLTDVIAAEARQGRTVRVAIQHTGGWAVSEDNPAHGRTEAIVVNWDSECVDWTGREGEADD